MHATELGESSNTRLHFANPRQPWRNATQMAKDIVAVLSQNVKGVHLIYLEPIEVSNYHDTKGRMASGACIIRHSVLSRAALK